MSSTVRALGTRIALASKPVETPVVIMAHEVKCACGCLWLATEKLTADAGNHCPECRRPPAIGRFGPLEPHHVTIPVQFIGGVKSVVLL